MNAPSAAALRSPATGSRRTVALASETDLDGFRRAARELFVAGWAPEAVDWRVTDGAEPELFGQPDDGLLPAADTLQDNAPKGAEAEPVSDADADAVLDADAAPPANPTLAVPAAFLSLCRSVILHSERQRFALLYRLFWRLQHEPGLRHDSIDPDRSKAALMAQAVRRDMHKMTAFVRFREVARDGLPTLHVAWFEPQHHIVEATAPFFMRRFANMPWAILTPERCVRWDGQALHFSPGASKQDAPPADAGEALWLTYYQHIFNPARLKLRMMEKEMPRRYWHNLPEATLISTLAASAQARTGAMVAREAAPTRRRLVGMASPAAPAGEGLVAAHRLPAEDMVSTSHTGRQIVHQPGDRGAARAAPSTTDGLQPTLPAAPAPHEPQAVPVTLHGRRDAWTEQRAAAAHCRECPIGALATQTVWGDGPLTAALMFVGEQPGDQEDLQGKPFVGPSGQLLNRAMAQLGWDRSVAYVTNAVKHFKYEPRGKRRVHKSPAQREADACQHWLESEIALVQPQALVALGATAARQLMGRPVAVMRERGQWLQRLDGLPVLVTLHPSALLRADPTERETAFAAWLQDLRQADAIARSASANGDAAAEPAAALSHP